jgi:hypothetical protein
VPFYSKENSTVTIVISSLHLLNKNVVESQMNYT